MDGADPQYLFMSARGWVDPCADNISPAGAIVLCAAPAVGSFEGLLRDGVFFSSSPSLLLRARFSRLYILSSVFVSKPAPPWRWNFEGGRGGWRAAGADRRGGEQQGAGGGAVGRSGAAIRRCSCWRRSSGCCRSWRCWRALLAAGRRRCRRPRRRDGPLEQLAEQLLLPQLALLESSWRLAGGVAGGESSRRWSSWPSSCCCRSWRCWRAAGGWPAVLPAAC